MSKAIATHALVVIGIAFMFFSFGLGFFLYWMKQNESETSRAACIAKLTDYCYEWALKGFDDAERPDWSGKDPTGCEKFGITEPDDRNDCVGYT